VGGSPGDKGGGILGVGTASALRGTEKGVGKKKKNEPCEQKGPLEPSVSLGKKFCCKKGLGRGEGKGETPKNKGGGPAANRGWLAVCAFWPPNRVKDRGTVEKGGGEEKDGNTHNNLRRKCPPRGCEMGERRGRSKNKEILGTEKRKKKKSVVGNTMRAEGEGKLY